MIYVSKSGSEKRDGTMDKLYEFFVWLQGYLFVFIVFVVVIGIAVLIGVKTAKAKNQKAEAMRAAEAETPENRGQA